LVEVGWAHPAVQAASGAASVLASMSMDRCVAMLLQTPKRRQSKRQDDLSVLSPPRSAKRLAAPSAHNDIGEKATSSPDDAAVLARLFEGLESVLVLLGSRRTRTTLPVVRENVQAFTSKDLSDDRFERILGLAGDMLEVAWNGTGSYTALEVMQRTKDGEARLPTAAERLERRSVFDAALLAAKGLEPRRKLPPRPVVASETTAQQQVPEGREPKALRDWQGAAEHQTQHKLHSGSQGENTRPSRLEALRARVLQRQDSNKMQAAHKAELDALERRMAVCEDAQIAHGIVVQLFARGEGASSAASEAEVVAALTASRIGMQTRRPLDVESAREAIGCLALHAAGWFRLEAPQYTRRAGGFLRRNDGGLSEAAAAALRDERARLLQERHALETRGPQPCDPEEQFEGAIGIATIAAPSIAADPAAPTVQSAAEVAQAAVPVQPAAVSAAAPSAQPSPRPRAAAAKRKPAATRVTEPVVKAAAEPLAATPAAPAPAIAEASALAPAKRRRLRGKCPSQANQASR